MTLPEATLMKQSRIVPRLFVLFAAFMAISLPASPWFLSVSQFLLAGLFIAQGISLKQYKAFFRRHPLVVILGIIPFHIYIAVKSVFSQLKNLERPELLAAFLIFYLVHIAGAFYSDNTHETMVSLRIKLPALILPLFFFTIRGVTQRGKNLILLLFVLSTFVVALISFTIFISGRFDDIREISPFIHHIQFSILIAWSIVILIYARHNNLWSLPAQKIWIPVLAMLLGLFLLVILKSLTGIGVLMAALYFVLFRKESFGLKLSNWVQRAALILGPLLVAIFLVYAFNRFYDIQKIDADTLNDTTELGNAYEHFPENKMLENGNYVFYFIAEQELREAWNSRSTYDYDSLDDRGQEIKYILIRYLTSLGLRKDARSLQQLDEEQISHIEAGLANYIYANNYSLYARVYQIIWEIDRYIHTADPSDHSFTQRIESIRIGTRIALNNPLFGVGTGDIKDEYHAIYNQRSIQQEDHQRIVGAHQLLNFVVGFGIIGFLLIAFAFLYPAIRTSAFANPLFNAFAVISLVAMFGEDMLKFQGGITFFTFFYCYFVFLKTDEK